MTYDSLSHPMLRQSSPKNITCDFISSQKTIAERLLNISRIRGGTYFKYTDIQYSTVDKLISKTKILYVSVITVPKNMTSTYISHDFSTVQLFLKNFSLRRQSEKNVNVQRWYCMQKNTLDWRKIEIINAPLRIQQIIHLTRLDCSSFCTWFGKFSDMMEKTHNRKQESRQNTKDKTKKTTCRRH